MAAALNRAAFFNAVRGKPFGGSLSQGQVTGLTSLFDACPPLLSSDALAYCLATAFHETAKTMLPVKEYGGEAYCRRMYDINGARPLKAKELGNTVPGDGAKFAGRGYVQLTGRANYRRATGELQAIGVLDRTMDLTVAPDMAMVPDVAAAILYRGMAEGWFTGRKLSQFFGPVTSNPKGARTIINGTDKAGEIAEHFHAFRLALDAAGHVPGAVEPVPVPPVTAGPLVAPAPRNSGVLPVPGPSAPAEAQQPSKGFWGDLADRFRTAFPPKKV